VEKLKGPDLNPIITTEFFAEPAVLISPALEQPIIVAPGQVDFIPARSLFCSNLTEANTSKRSKKSSLALSQAALAASLPARKASGFSLVPTPTAIVTVTLVYSKTLL
jgi:hypothetical protein